MATITTPGASYITLWGEFINTKGMTNGRTAGPAIRKNKVVWVRRSILSSVLSYFSKGYRANRIADRMAFVNCLEDAVRKEFDGEHLYSENGTTVVADAIAAKDYNPDDYTSNHSNLNNEVVGKEVKVKRMKGMMTPTTSHKAALIAYRKAHNGTVDGFIVPGKDDKALRELFTSARINASLNGKAYAEAVRRILTSLCPDKIDVSDVTGKVEGERLGTKIPDSAFAGKYAETCCDKTLAYEDSKRKAYSGYVPVVRSSEPLKELAPAVSPSTEIVEDGAGNDQRAATPKVRTSPEPDVIHAEEQAD